MIFKEKKYRFIHELDSGNFGKTFLIKDNYIDELFICKKYESQEGIKKRLFQKLSIYFKEVCLYILEKSLKSYYHLFFE